MPRSLKSTTVDASIKGRGGGDQNVIADLYLLERSFPVATFYDFVICPGYASFPASNPGKRTENRKKADFGKRLTSLSLRLTKTNRTNI